MAGDTPAPPATGNWLRRVAAGGGKQPAPDSGPRIMLVLQPVGQPQVEYARLRRELLAAGCRSQHDEARIVAAAFADAHDAVDLALRLLERRGNSLRAALSVGALGSDGEHLPGAALADARIALRYAGPGSLVLGTRFSPTLLDDVRPDLAHLLQPVTSGRRDAAPMAHVVDGAALATLRANPRASPATRRQARTMRRALAITAGVMLVAAVAWLAGRARERAPAPAATVPMVTLAAASKA